MSLFRFQLGCLVLLLLLAGGCTRKTVSFNSRAGDLAVNALPTGDSLTTTARRASLSTAAKKAKLSKEEEKAAKEQEKDAQRKKPRKKKKIFLGERIKRAYVKTGSGGRTQVIEIFYYLRTFQQPNPQAPARYYYNPRKRKIYKATGPLDPATDKVLHGPYKKVQNNLTLETGYFALGTRHLRWERFDQKGTLTAKTHYEMGFPRDANISYFDAGQTMLKEVVPYVNGKLEGDYVKYSAEGKREWTGQFENGHRIGEWTSYWGSKNYRHYVLQYGASGYEPEVAEPELLREYTEGGLVVYDKEKNIDKRGEAPAEAAANDARRPGNHGQPAARPAPVRKPAERRPGYHPKPVATPPAVPATPAGS